MNHLAEHANKLVRGSSNQFKFIKLRALLDVLHMDGPEKKTLKPICSTKSAAQKNVATSSGVNNVFPKLIFNNVEYAAANDGERERREKCIN